MPKPVDQFARTSFAVVVMAASVLLAMYLVLTVTAPLLFLLWQLVPR